MQFAAITGLDDIKHTLIRAVQRNHVAHAQLFFGKEGSANLALALAYATYLNCENPSETDSCGVCPSCSRMKKLMHPDLHFVFPTAATKDYKRDEAMSSLFLKEWRSFLQKNSYANLQDWGVALGLEENKQCLIPVHEGREIIKTLSMRAFGEKYKIMIIWLVELMNVQAANAILKILEEPPEKTIFLLVSNSLDKMLPTILSRTQIIVIRQFNDEEIREHLQTQLNTPADKAAQIAVLADGSLGEAIRLSQEVQDDSQAFFEEWMRYCYQMDFSKMLQGVDKFSDLSKEAQKGVLYYALTVIREAMVLKMGSPLLVRLDEKTLQFVQKFSQTVIRENNVEKFLQYFNEAIGHIERNASAKILFLDLSLKLAHVLRTK